MILHKIYFVDVPQIEGEGKWIKGTFWVFFYLFHSLQLLSTVVCMEFVMKGSVVEKNCLRMFCTVVFLSLPAIRQQIGITKDVFVCGTDGNTDNDRTDVVILPLKKKVTDNFY